MRRCIDAAAVPEANQKAGAIMTRHIICSSRFATASDNSDLIPGRDKLARSFFTYEVAAMKVRIEYCVP